MRIPADLAEEHFFFTQPLTKKRRNTVCRARHTDTTLTHTHTYSVNGSTSKHTILTHTHTSDHYMCRAADLVWNSVTSDRPFFGVLLSKKRMTFNQQLVNVIYMMLSMQTVIQHNVSRELCFMYKWKTDTTLNAHRCIGCFILFLFLLLNMRNREYICKCYSNSPTLFRFHLIVSNVMLCAFFHICELTDTPWHLWWNHYFF